MIHTPACEYNYQQEVLDISQDNWWKPHHGVFCRSGILGMIKTDAAEPDGDGVNVYDLQSQRPLGQNSTLSVVESSRTASAVEGIY